MSTPTTEIYTLSLHDALPIYLGAGHEDVVAHELHLLAEPVGQELPPVPIVFGHAVLDGDDRILVDPRRQIVDHLRRSEEHTSELQSLTNLVCRLLLEKKKSIS